MKSIKIIGSELLHIFGVLWLLVEATSYFVNEKTSIEIKSFWWVFLIIGFIIAIIRLIPKRRFSFIVDDRDITVELVIGDIFKEKGTIVVGSNTGFITNSEIISSKSIQGVFCSKYFPSIQPVNDQITSQIQSTPCEFGTTVTVRGSSKTGYFCVIAEVNASGIAKSNIENLRVSLVGLWSYLSENAEKDIINLPILGSGFSRITARREELVKELLLSFFAAISQNTFCDGIRVVINPSDIKTFNIDVNELARYFEYSCKYSLIEQTSTVTNNDGGSAE